MITALDALLLSPWVSVFLLSVLFIEAVWLLYMWQKRKIGLPPRQILTFLGAGACFAVALGFGLSNSGSIFIATSLIAAFVFHMLDLWQRWQI